MAYTYRFMDKYNNTIYVGYTGQTMAQRMGQHFTKGHLPKKCYDEVAKIEYIQWKTKCDAQIMEVYYINKYKPKYNKQDKRGDNLTIHLEEKDWKLYKGLKRQVKRYEAEKGVLTWVMIAALIVAIIQMLLGGKI